MSDEPATPPPALRLKPRLTLAEPESPPAAQATPVAGTPPPPPADAEPPKLRLKPRLLATPGDAEPATVSAAPAEPAGVAPPPPPEVIAPAALLPPALSAAPIAPPPPATVPTASLPPPPPPAAASTPAPAGEAVTLKLKAKLAAPPPPQGEAPPAVPASAPTAPVKFPPPPAAAPPPPPPFPVVAPPSTGKTTPPIPHISVTAEEPAQEEPGPAKPEQRRAFKLGVAAAGLAALLGLGAGGYFFWTKLISPPLAPLAAKPAAPAPAAAMPVTSSRATKPAAPLTPSDTANALAHAPVNAINKAQEAVNARRASEQSRLDAMASGQDAPAKPAADAPPLADAAKAGKSAGPAAMKPAAAATLAPGVSATSSDVDAVAEASPAFRAFVANAKITGVIGGSPAKIILNGRLARSGDVVDPALGITFDRIDAERKLLVFKEKSGASVTRKY